MSASVCRSTILLGALLAASPCFAHHMAVVVSKQNTVTTMTSAQLGKILRTETKKWPDGKNIVVILHRSSPGEQVTLRHLNKMTDQQWRTWLAEHKDAVKFVDSDEEVISNVERTPGGVGLIDVHSVNDRIVVVRIDGKFPMEDGYLSH
jgi:ABC-type phosphate transport system substrate-binding protein